MLDIPDNLSRLVVRYEDLNAGLGGEARRIGDWLGVGLEPGAVEADRDRCRTDMTATSAGVSVGRWQHDLSGDDVARIMTEFDDPAGSFGYDL